MIEIETERAVLGAVLVHPKVVVEIGSLAPDHFHEMRHAALWGAIKKLDEAQQPIDTLSVYAQMERDKTSVWLEPHGGRRYLEDLMSEVVTVENIDYHGKRLVLAAKRRAWRMLAATLASAASNASMDAEEFVELAERETAALSASGAADAGPLPIRRVLKGLTATLERRSENRREGGVSGVPTGLNEVDRMTLGFQPGDLVVVAARPSMGKTALALNVVAEAISAGHPALVFSLEMSAESLAERLVSREGRILANTMRTGKLNQLEWIKLHRTMSDLSVRKLEIDERGGIDVNEVRRTARHWRARQKGDVLGIVVVDYLQLLRATPASAKMQNREREVAEQSRTLKELAKEIKCPVVALAQLNRGLESRADKRPMMSDLRESGAIEQDADVIAFIYRECVYEKNADERDAEIIFGKQRNGVTGTARVKWDGLTQRFSNA